MGDTDDDDDDEDEVTLKCFKRAPFFFDAFCGLLLLSPMNGVGRMPKAASNRDGLRGRLLGEIIILVGDLLLSLSCEV